ncbi:endothelial differentiation-related factor 1 homolog [Drosophila miranda]|uniref:endothelial differentiation-related factor 1 homolog n=1 Tax=Drosophila miranda TaxID=7229 RepID=UPI00143F9C96|nr:endothelial differentiation-related factor 1 homolog [Drosophila miranda]
MSSTNLDYETMSQRRDKLPQDVCRLIMQGRQAKGLSQKELASKIFEKPQVIGDYEAGRGIPKDQILAKIERIIGIKLLGKNRGMPLKKKVGKKK